MTTTHHPAPSVRPGLNHGAWPGLVRRCTSCNGRAELDWDDHEAISLGVCLSCLDAADYAETLESMRYD